MNNWPHKVESNHRNQAKIKKENHMATKNREDNEEEKKNSHSGLHVAKPSGYQNAQDGIAKGLSLSDKEHLEGSQRVSKKESDMKPNLRPNLSKLNTSWKNLLAEAEFESKSAEQQKDRAHTLSDYHSAKTDSEDLTENNVISRKRNNTTYINRIKSPEKINSLAERDEPEEDGYSIKSGLIKNQSGVTNPINKQETIKDKDYTISRMKRPRDADLEFYERCDFHDYDTMIEPKTYELILVTGEHRVHEEVESDEEEINKFDYEGLDRLMEPVDEVIEDSPEINQEEEHHEEEKKPEEEKRPTMEADNDENSNEEKLSHHEKANEQTETEAHQELQQQQEEEEQLPIQNQVEEKKVEEEEEKEVTKEQEDPIEQEKEAQPDEAEREEPTYLEKNFQPEYMYKEAEEIEALLPELTADNPEDKVVELVEPVIEEMPVEIPPKKALFIDLAVRNLDPRVVRLTYIYRGLNERKINKKQRLLVGQRATRETVEVKASELLAPNFSKKQFNEEEKHKASNLILGLENSTFLEEESKVAYISVQRSSSCIVLPQIKQKVPKLQVSNTQYKRMLREQQEDIPIKKKKFQPELTEKDIVVIEKQWLFEFLPKLRIAPAALDRDQPFSAQEINEFIKDRYARKREKRAKIDSGSRAQWKSPNRSPVDYI